MSAKISFTFRCAWQRRKAKCALRAISSHARVTTQKPRKSPHAKNSETYTKRIQCAAYQSLSVSSFVVPLCSTHSHACVNVYQPCPPKRVLLLLLRVWLYHKKKRKTVLSFLVGDNWLVLFPLRLLPSWRAKRTFAFVFDWLFPLTLMRPFCVESLTLQQQTKKKKRKMPLQPPQTKPKEQYLTSMTRTKKKKETHFIIK